MIRRENKVVETEVVVLEVTKDEAHYLRLYAEAWLRAYSHFGNPSTVAFAKNLIEELKS